LDACWTFPYVPFFPVAEKTDMSNYIGFLLIDDSLRASHKQKFEHWLNESTESNAQALSTHAVLVITSMANRLAAGDASHSGGGSFILGFGALIWNHKKALKK
jgi:hypothetical protein